MARVHWRMDEEGKDGRDGKSICVEQKPDELPLFPSLPSAQGLTHSAESVDLEGEASSLHISPESEGEARACP